MKINTHIKIGRMNKTNRENQKRQENIAHCDVLLLKLICTK